MMKMFLIIMIFCTALIGCTDESTLNLTEKYGLSEKVLKSSEFKEYVSAIGIGIEKSKDAREEFSRLVNNNPTMIEKVENGLSESENEMSKSNNYTSKDFNETMQNTVGAAPFDVSMNNVIKEKREKFFLKFPEFQNNSREMEKVKNYIQNEILKNSEANN